MAQQGTLTSLLERGCHGRRHGELGPVLYNLDPAERKADIELLFTFNCEFSKMIMKLVNVSMVFNANGKFSHPACERNFPVSVVPSLS